MFDIKDAYETRENLITNLQLLKAELDKLDQSIKDHYHEQFRAALFAKDEPFGTVNVEDGSVKITLTVPKKVKWDQDKLEALYREIYEDGEDPLEYLKVKYDVSENAYKSWPSAIVKAFEPARTVEEGSVSLKLEVKDVA